MTRPTHRQRINRERAARIGRKRRRAEAERFGAVIRRGGIIYCNPATFAALQRETEPVAMIGGVEIRSSSYVPPGALYAVQPKQDIPSFSFAYRKLW